MLESPLTTTASAAAPPSGRAAVLSLATEVPAGRLTNAELAQTLGISEDWIVSRTGIHERPRAAADERLSDYGIRVGAEAVRRAGLAPNAIDLVICATLTQDELTPNAAPLIAHGIGATGAGAFDVGAACTAFLTGLSVAAAQVESGRAQHVLLVGADFVTRITNYEDRKSAPLFADGAGAVVVGAPRTPAEGAIGPIVLGSDGSHGETLIATHAERKLAMDGQEVFRHAVNRMHEVTLRAVDRAGLTLADIDLFAYHQANGRITRALGERLGVDPARVVDCIAQLGNSSAATLPLALAAAQADGRLKPGARVLVSAFGAGFTYGAGVLTWGGR